MPRFLRWPFAVCLLAGVVTGCASERDQRLSQLKNADPERDPLKGKHIPSPNLPTGRDAYAKDKSDPLLRAEGSDPADPIRTPDRRTGGNTTGRDLTLGSTATPEQMGSELTKAGVKVGTPMKADGGGYEVRVEVPMRDGAKSWYTGGGPTAAAAMKDAYEQVRTGWR